MKDPEFLVTEESETLLGLEAFVDELVATSLEHDVITLDNGYNYIHWAIPSKSASRAHILVLDGEYAHLMSTGIDDEVLSKGAEEGLDDKYEDSPELIIYSLRNRLEAPVDNLTFWQVDILGNGIQRITEIDSELLQIDFTDVLRDLREFFPEN